MPYHLPVLLNPLLNAVFNCPSPQTSSLKQLFSKLADEKFILLAPTTEVLLHYQAIDIGKDLSELCYHYDFVASHVIVIKNDGKEREYRVGQGSEFTTLNGKKVIIRYQNKSIVTALGFDIVRKVAICETRSLLTFNDYLKGSHYTPIIYIDRPLCGELALSKSLDAFSTAYCNPFDKTMDKNSNIAVNEPLNLVSTVQSYPDIDKSMSLVFHLCKLRIQKCVTIEEIHSEWMQTRQSVSEVVKDDKRIKNLENIQKSIYDYVEMKIYGDIYDAISRLVHDDELEEMYDFETLKYISLNQVSTMFYSEKANFSMRSIVRIEKSLKDAVDCFKSIDERKTHLDKLEVLRSTLEYLGGKGNQQMIDADSLLGLFVLTICRSQVRCLKANFIYLSTFAFVENSIKFGVSGYAMSTLEAVLSFFTSETVQSLLLKCQENKMIWKLLEQKRNISSNRLSEEIQIRTDNGESIVSLCIQNHHNEALIDILLNYQEELPLEDLLEDRDSSGSTLLIQALQVRNLEAVRIFSAILKNSCSEQEILEYVNAPNKYQRILGHYLMQDEALLEDLGNFVNWEFKDINGHTPLFAIFRSYDTPGYDNLVERVLKIVEMWYAHNQRKFNTLIHEDEKGNSLLHVLKSNVKILLPIPGLNLHKLDRKGMTPLMIYSRYNRLENIEAIMKDDRLIWDKVQQPLAMTCLDCTKNPATVRTIISTIPERSTVFLHSLKFEEKRWNLSISCDETNEFSLKFIQKLLNFLSKKYYLGFHPIEFLNKELKMLGIFGLPSILRLQTNDTFKKLSLYLSYVNNEQELSLQKDEKGISSLIERSTEFLSESEKFVLLEPEQVNAIQVFLKFNQLEFTKLKTQITVLKKLTIVQELKLNDITAARNLLPQLGTQLHKTNITDCFKNMKFSTGSTNSYQQLMCGFEFLEACFDALLKSIDVVLKKIVFWWKSYGELVELRKEYKKNFPDNGAHENGNGKNFIDSLIEGKRSNYKNRLSAQLKATSTKLRKYGGEIKDDNELIAVNFNLFIEFKEKFYYELVIKLTTSYKIKEAKEHVTTLEEMKRIAFM